MRNFPVKLEKSDMLLKPPQRWSFMNRRRWMWRVLDRGGGKRIANNVSAATNKRSTKGAAIEYTEEIYIDYT